MRVSASKEMASPEAAAHEPVHEVQQVTREESRIDPGLGCKTSSPSGSGWEILTNIGWVDFEPGTCFDHTNFKFKQGKWEYRVTFTSDDVGVQENLQTRKRRPLRRKARDDRRVQDSERRRPDADAESGTGLPPGAGPSGDFGVGRPLSVPSDGWHIHTNRGWQPFCPNVAFSSDFEFTHGWDYKVNFSSESHGFQENLQTGSRRVLRRWPGLLSDDAQKKLCITGALKGIGALVAKEVPAWAGLDPDRIRVEDSSGRGGSRTYRVSARGDGGPPAVAVHVRSSEVLREPLSERRMAKAAEVFAAAGASPGWLAKGDDWFVEPWAGQAIKWPGEPDSETSAARLGQLLAKIHKIPTAWFDEFREQLIRLKPALLGAARGSTLWWATCRLEAYLGSVDEACLSTLLAVEPMPKTGPAARLVTCHGDFHSNNVVHSDKRLVAIDLEFGHTNFAVFDLASIFQTCLRTARLRRDFIKAYLEETGDPTDAEFIDAATFDVECFRGLAFYGGGVWQLTLARACVSDLELECLRRFTLAVDEIAASPEQRQQVVELGFERCSTILQLRLDAADARRQDQPRAAKQRRL